MPTPPMLRGREPSDRGRRNPDPLVSLNVAAMAVLSLGLFLAAILAVYDWRTPGAEAPLVLCLAVIALATFALDILVVGLRYVRRLRLGL